MLELSKPDLFMNEKFGCHFCNDSKKGDRKIIAVGTEGKIRMQRQLCSVQPQKPIKAAFFKAINSVLESSQDRNYGRSNVLNSHIPTVVWGHFTKLPSCTKEKKTRAKNIH